MKKIAIALLLVLYFCPFASGKKKWVVPCQKVFLTGTQKHEIAWALRGDGLKNNLYKNTCQQPVSDPAEADAILDIEYDPKQVVDEAARERREFYRNTQSNDYSVICSSTMGHSYCRDSQGYALYTDCTDRGCSSYYGPDPVQEIGNVLFNVLDELSYKLDKHFEDTSAWGYMFSTKDHHMIWKYEGMVGTWHYDLTKYAQCQHPLGKPVCKKPTALLQEKQ